MIRSHAAMLGMLAVVAVAVATGATGDAPGGGTESKPAYAYATRGVWEDLKSGAGVTWKLVLDESNLGGKELEAAEVTLPAGTAVQSHRHGSLEVIYVLSGVYGHEVNGKLYLLKAGMVGIVRPGDSVRHLVPKTGDTKLLILWAPAGEAAKLFQQRKGSASPPVPQASSLESPSP
jgi:quercetin dioxygenase-like cupin family protein